MGTVACDWWFFDDAIVLDTAGRFAVHEGDSPVVPVWKKFVNLLRKQRKGRPIDGVVLVIPADALTGSVEDAAAEGKAARAKDATRKGKQLRSKILELREKLGVVFPVYILVTKCDKLMGFEETFALLDSEKQASMFGWGSPHPLEAPFEPQWVDEAFDSAQQDLEAMRLELLRRGSMTRYADLVYLFPEEFARLRPALKAYLESIFSGNRFEEVPPLRGVFFASNGKDGQKLSSLINYAKKGGQPSEAPRLESGADEGFQGMSYFVHDVYRKKVFRERGLAYPTRRDDKLVGAKRYAKVAGFIISVVGTAALTYLFVAATDPLSQINTRLSFVKQVAGAQDPLQIPTNYSDSTHPLPAAYRKVAQQKPRLEKNILATGIVDRAHESLGGVAARGFGQVAREAQGRSPLLSQGDSLLAYPADLRQVREGQQRVKRLWTESLPVREAAAEIVSIYSVPKDGVGAILGQFLEDPAEDFAAPVRLGLPAEEVQRLAATGAQAEFERRAGATMLLKASGPDGFAFERFQRMLAAGKQFDQRRKALADGGGLAEVRACVQSYAALKTSVDAAQARVASAPAGAAPGEAETDSPQEDKSAAGDKPPPTKAELKQNAKKEGAKAAMKGAASALEAGKGAIFGSDLPEPEPRNTPIGLLLAADFPAVQEALNRLHKENQNPVLLASPMTPSPQEILDRLTDEAESQLQAAVVAQDGTQLSIEGSPEDLPLLDYLAAHLDRWPTVAELDSACADNSFGEELVRGLLNSTRPGAEENPLEKFFQHFKERVAAFDAAVQKATPASPLVRAGIDVLRYELCQLAEAERKELEKATVGRDAEFKILRTQRSDKEFNRCHDAAWAKAYDQIVDYRAALETLLGGAASITCEQHELWRSEDAFLPRTRYATAEDFVRWQEGRSLSVFARLYERETPEALIDAWVKHLKEYVTNCSDAIKDLPPDREVSSRLKRLEVSFGPGSAPIEGKHLTDVRKLFDSLSALPDLTASAAGALAGHLKAVELRRRASALGDRTYLSEQVAKLYGTLYIQLKVLLAYTLVDEIESFAKEYQTDFANRFPFRSDATEEADIQEFQDLCSNDRFRFLLSANDNEKDSPSFDSMAKLCKPVLSPDVKAYGRLTEFLQKLKDQSEFLGAEQAFSVHFRPEKGIRREVTRLDAFAMEFPVDSGRFELCPTWDHRKRDALWNKGPSGTLPVWTFAGADLRQRITLTIGCSAPRGEIDTVDFQPGNGYLLEEDEEPCDLGRAAKVSRTLALRESGRLSLLRLIAMFETDPADRKIVGHWLRFPVFVHRAGPRLERRPDAKPLPFVVVLTFWAGNRAKEAPEFEVTVPRLTKGSWSKAGVETWADENWRG